MTTEEKVLWMAYGILTLLVFKYLVFGLDSWNGVLHPGRQEPDNLHHFRRPLLSNARKR